MKRLLLLLCLFQFSCNLNSAIYYADYSQYLNTIEGKEILRKEKDLTEKWNLLFHYKNKKISKLMQNLLAQEHKLYQRKSKLRHKFDIEVSRIMKNLGLSCLADKKLPINFKDKFNMTQTIINKLNQKYKASNGK